MAQDNLILSDPQSSSEDDEAYPALNRFKDLFKDDPTGAFKPQLSLVIQSSTAAFMMGGMFGAVVESKNVYTKFVLENQATMFYSHKEAKKVVADKMFLAYMRGGWKLGWRFAVFSGMSMFTMVAVEALRGKSTPFDLGAGGAMAGFLYKSKFGPKPMISGAMVGGMFGLIGGVALHSLLWLTGLTMKDLYENEVNDFDRREINELANTFSEGNKK